MEEIKLKKIRTCSGCRAAPYLSGGSGSECSIGYKIKNTISINGDSKPLEKCPKPLTYKQYFKVLAYFRNNKVVK